MLRSTRPSRNFGRSRNLGKPGVKGQLVDFNNQNLSCGGFWLGWLMVCVLYSKIISELFGQVIEADFSRMEAETTASEASRLDPTRLFSNDTCWTQAMLTCFEVPAPLLHVGFHFFFCKICLAFASKGMGLPWVVGIKFWRHSLAIRRIVIFYHLERCPSLCH